MDATEIPIASLDWGRHIHARLQTTLQDHQIVTLGQLTACTAKDLYNMPRIYHGSVWAVRRQLATYGLTLKGEELSPDQKAVGLVAAVLATLPAPHTVWPRSQREDWLQEVREALDMVYK